MKPAPALMSAPSAFPGRLQPWESGWSARQVTIDLFEGPAPFDRLRQTEIGARHTGAGPLALIRRHLRDKP